MIYDIYCILHIVHDACMMCSAQCICEHSGRYKRAVHVHSSLSPDAVFNNTGRTSANISGVRVHRASEGGRAGGASGGCVDGDGRQQQQGQQSQGQQSQGQPSKQPQERGNRVAEGAVVVGAAGAGWEHRSTG